MSHTPKTYVRITVDFGSGEHSLNHDMDGVKITEAEVVRVFDRSKWAAVAHLRGPEIAPHAQEDSAETKRLKEKMAADRDEWIENLRFPA